ncbi:MAG: hypothetical protein ACO1N9_11245 [Flavobacterium sp.]
MKEDFKIIRDAFEEAGVEINSAEYSITPYSLNTKLSFKFNNLEELLEFLGVNDSQSNPKAEAIRATFVKESLDSNNFFYVNFYKPKVAEL